LATLTTAHQNTRVHCR